MIRLVYASSAAVKFAPEAVATLLRKARANNGQLQVSGVLLFHEGSFLQVLEGQAEVVEALYQKIMRDPRHENMLLLDRGDINERSFGAWTMGSLELPPTASTEGMNDFLKGGPLVLKADPAKTQRVLDGFRDGRYRQFVR